MWTMSDDAAAAEGRFTRWKRRGSEVAEDLGDRVDDARSRIPAVDLSFAALERDTRMGGFVLAGALAFRLFVFLLPLYLLALVVAGAALSVDPGAPESLARTAGVSGSLASVVGEAAASSKRSLWILVPVTLAGLAMAANSAFKVLHTAHTRAWDLDVKRSAKSSAAAAGAFLLAGITVALGHFVLRSIRHGVLIPFAMALGTAYYGTLWLVVSHGLPRARRASWPWLVPGALVVGVGTQGLYLFTVLYMNRKIQSASEAYGALGIAASCMAWLYLVGRLIVAAPVLNATLWERYGAPDATHPLSSRWPFRSATATTPDSAPAEESSPRV